MPARIQRGLIVTHPAFLLTNNFQGPDRRHAADSICHRPYVDQARGVMHELKGDKVVRTATRVDGAIGGMQSAEERMARLKSDIRVPNSKGIQNPPLRQLQGTGPRRGTVGDGTRLGLFERGTEKFLKEGMTPYEAAKEASFEAWDYMDFDRRGAWPAIQVMMRSVLANATSRLWIRPRRVVVGIMQPNEVGERLFGRPPATREEQAKFNTAVKLLTGAVLLATGSMAWRAANKDNPEFEEIQNYVRDTAWVVPLDDTHYVAIPKPYEIGALSNVAERWYEAAAEHDPTAWGKLAQGVFTQLAPPVDPAIAQLVWGLGTNKNSFGAPIVPDDQKNVRPEFQYNDRTSEFGKAVGHLTAGLPGPLPQSPADIDFIVQTLEAPPSVARRLTCRTANVRRSRRARRTASPWTAS